MHLIYQSNLHLGTYASVGMTGVTYIIQSCIHAIYLMFVCAERSILVQRAARDFVGSRAMGSHLPNYTGRYVLMSPPPFEFGCCDGSARKCFRPTKREAGPRLLQSNIIKI